MRKKPANIDTVYLLIAFAIMAGLYYSSSMGYEEQTVQPLLHRLLENEPLRWLLERVEFMYAGSEVSVGASGYIGFIEFFLRKGAHFISYFALGLFWFLGLRNRVNNIWMTALLSILLAAGYASFDELRQSFNPDRTALMQDVILDTVGAVVGVGMALFPSMPNKRRRKSSRLKK